MPAILTLLLQLVPMIPSLISAGKATVDIYSSVQKVIDEHRPPVPSEWDELEAMIKRDQQTVRDTSRDV